MPLEERLSAGAAPYDTTNLGEVAEHIFRGVDGLRKEDGRALSELTYAYNRANFDRANEIADVLVDSDDLSVAMTARTSRMSISVASGDSAQAYSDLLVLEELCADGLKKRDDVQLFSASVINALRVESLVMAPLFNLSELPYYMESIPNGLKMYFGYLMALRMFRRGRAEGALGIAYTFQTLVGSMYPGSRTYLHLVSAATSLVLGHKDHARTQFEKAWQIKDEFGIIMPFIELDHILLGLAREYRHDEGRQAEFQRAVGLINLFHDGWYGLRRKCGLSYDTETLTILEGHVAALAALGWRNREIANHLDISENTVKHRLSSVYLKLHVTSRADLRRMFSGYGVPPSGLWA